MKNILIKTLAGLAVSFLAVGCIEESFPQGGVQTKDQVLKNDSALDAMLNSLPAIMMTSGSGGTSNHCDFGMGTVVLATESMLEDMACMAENVGFNWFQFWAAADAQDDRSVFPRYFWRYYYDWIKKTNDVIKLIDPNTSDAHLQNLLGQAHAYRASFYLDLARLYEPKQNTYKPVPDKILGLTVPIVTENTTEEMAKNNPRVPRKDMYDFILSDLDKAEKLLASTAAKAVYTQPSLYVVNGLRARAYLELGTTDGPDAYRSAAKYAQKVIEESGCTPLTQLQWEDPSTGFNDGESNDAWLWGLTSNSEIQGNLHAFIAHASYEGMWGYGPYCEFGCNKKLYEKISDKDFRKHSWIDPQGKDYYDYKFAGPAFVAAARWTGLPDPQNPINVIKPYQSIKFRPNEGEVFDYTIGNAGDLCLMRIEEMYFIQAEALAHLGLLGEASTVLNSIVNTRYADKSYDSSNKTYDKDAFIEELILQKRIEFWGEGIMIYDYKRLDLGIERSYYGSNYAADLALNCKGRSPMWNIVIPRSEYQNNVAITEDLNNPDPTQFVKPTPFEK